MAVEKLPGNIATTNLGLVFFVTDKPRILQRDSKFGSRILSLEYANPTIEATVKRFKGSGLLLLTGESLGERLHPAVGFGAGGKDEHFRVSGVNLADGSVAVLLAKGLIGSFSSVPGFPDFSTSPTRPGKFFVRKPAVAGVSMGGMFEASEAEILASGVRTGRPNPRPKLRTPPPALPARAKMPELRDGVAGPTVHPTIVESPKPVPLVMVAPPVSQVPLGLREDVPAPLAVDAEPARLPANPLGALVAALVVLIFLNMKR